MKKTGFTDLPLHYGSVPAWLYERMSRLGRYVIEALVSIYGKKEVLKRLSDPLWFQSLGCVMGMDWHSSGLTTSVIGALKSGLKPIEKDIGIYICGGRGKYSRNTPNELYDLSDRLGLDGDKLVTTSRLTAKIDNTAIQDGFSLYLHSFIVSDEGDWVVIQQGMNPEIKTARRYHWLSSEVKKFDEEPHTGVVGENRGKILNLTHKEAITTKEAILSLSRENPDKMLMEIKKLIMPKRHNVESEDVDLRRLGAVLATAYNESVKDFCSFLLIQGVGPRTLQSLVLVSEIIFGTPSRFTDPARYSFAHGGKDGHPFPVPLKTYDETINILKNAIEKSKIDNNEKLKAIEKLYKTYRYVEKNFSPSADFESVVNKEKRDSEKYGGKTVFG
ncbi:MAG: DUF763 domain-containing protein [Brevinematales bacterium]|nr:DUF763 domain-containing protein [Brevinematales bacterium]